MKWKFETTRGLPSPSIVSGNYVYVGDGSSIYCLNKNTGELKWKCDVQGFPTAVSGNYVYVASECYYCLDKYTGYTGGELNWMFCEMQRRGGSSLVISGDYVYFGSADGYVFAFASSKEFKASPKQPDETSKIEEKTGTEQTETGKPEPQPTQPTTEGDKATPGFETVFAIAGLLAVAYLFRRRK